MMLWPILALMTLGAVFAVCWPLLRRGQVVRSGSDVAVYRHQLDEVGRDEATGLVGKGEAEAARVEISRRLIAAADSAQAATAVAAPAVVRRYRRATLAAALVLLPLVAAAVYLPLGSPMLVPVAMNAAPGGAQVPTSVEKTVAQVETYLESHPQDGRGWELLGPVYMRLGRYDDAVKARQHALDILGPDAARLADLGEALVMAAGEIVTVEAKSLFDRAAEADPEDVMAQYYLGLAAKQDGRRDEAEKRWRALVSRADEGAEWLPLVKDALARIDQDGPLVAAAPGQSEVAVENAPTVAAAPVQPNQTTTSVASPGPTADDVAAAGQMSAAERNAMVETMVARLAQRMAQDGSDVDGWLRLMRAYSVLGDRSKAQAAIADARHALAGHTDSLRRIAELAKELGLEGS
jgi:cytochrome c-type biogenesis protein CcmH